MAKVNYYNLSEAERLGLLREMFGAIAALETAEEVENFFRDLLTLSELVMLSRRILIAKKLMAGDTYEEIIEALHVGTSTIMLVDKWLNQGFGGYRRLLRQAKAKREKINYRNDFDLSFDSLRHKYPAHFWLVNMFLDR